MSVKEEKKYFYFYKHESGKLYFYNPITDQTTWLLPKNGIMVDPESRKVISKKRELEESNSQKGFPPIQMGRGKRFKTMIEVPKTKVSKYFLPDSLEEDSEKNELSKLFDKIFAGSKGKKANSYTFQDSGISKSLLEQDKNNEKNAVMIFKNILKYTKVKDSKECEGKPIEIYEIANKGGAQLINELFAQLLKQTNECPKKFLKANLDLLIIFINVFTPSHDIGETILSHLARIFKKYEDENIKEFSLWCYIRSKSRIYCGLSNESEAITDKYLEKIPKQIQNSKKAFGISIEEIMFLQHKDYPMLQVPYVMHSLCEKLFENGCERHQGIFRLPGNMKTVNSYIELVNNGDYSFLNDGTINDIGSLFKLWIRQLTSAVINEKITDEILTTKGIDNYMVLINKLSTSHRNVLMYLVGFLKRLSLSSQITMMDAPNLAMVFGPNIVVSSDNVLQQSKISTHSTTFLKELINKWDVSSLYPLKSF